MHEALRALAHMGWRVEVGTALELPAVPRQRYRAIPVEVWRFLAVIRNCRSANDDAWILGPADYARSETKGFRWNECERIGLEASLEAATEARETQLFWDSHFPFMMAVHSDYDYLALDVGETRLRGSVVHGCAPDFEQVSVVAPDFSRFLVELTTAARSSAPSYPFSVFFGHRE
jgi:hypothetical protein